MNDLEKIAFVLDRMTDRLEALERSVHNLAAHARQINDAHATHAQSIRNLEQRMTHESLMMIGLVEDIKNKVDPLYDAAYPGYDRFIRQLDRIIKPDDPQKV